MPAAPPRRLAGVVSVRARPARGPRGGASVEPVGKALGEIGAPRPGHYNSSGTRKRHSRSLDQFIGDVPVGGRRSSGVVVRTDWQADEMGLAELGVLGDLVAEQRHAESVGDCADLLLGDPPVHACSPDAHLDDAVDLEAIVGAGNGVDGVEDRGQLGHRARLGHHRHDDARGAAERRGDDARLMPWRVDQHDVPVLRAMSSTSIKRLRTHGSVSCRPAWPIETSSAGSTSRLGYTCRIKASSRVA